MRGSVLDIMTQRTQYSMFRLAFTIWLLLSFSPALPLPMLATQTLLCTKVPGTCCIDYLGTRCCLTDYLPTSYVLARYQLRTNTNFCLCYPQNTCVITNLHAPDFLTARYIVAHVMPAAQHRHYYTTCWLIYLPMLHSCQSYGPETCSLLILQNSGLVTNFRLGHLKNLPEGIWSDESWMWHRMGHLQMSFVIDSRTAVR